MSQPKAIFLKDYRVPAYFVESVDLNFDLFDGYTQVRSVLQLVKNTDSTETQLCLNGENLQLDGIWLNEQPLSNDAYQLTDEYLYIDNLPAQATLRIDTTIHPEQNTALEGLYQSSGNYCTQCEAEGFRKITYYPDRPDVMATFTTRISADKSLYPYLLSNGNLVEQGDLADNRHYAVWHDPFKKPCYLFALVAGDFDLVQDHFDTHSGRRVALDLYVEKGFAHQTAFAMQSLKKSMAWDEQVFGLEYDLDIYMIVAVSDFNMGAMENKGLNVFNTKFVLADDQTATDVDYLGVEGVIAHEYFHNWTGNRVTCRNWFQLSLKEGLTVFRDQQFSADMHDASVKRIEDVSMLRERQFAEDAGPMAHPIRPASYIEMNNFYTLTVYEKGAEVIRMLHTMLGQHGFRKGMDLYFQRHDGDAVTTEDFVAAMADANQRDFSQFQHWYDYAGTPYVSFAGEYDAATQCYRMTFKQHCPATPGQSDKPPFLIPVKMALLNAQGDDMSVTGPEGDVATQFTLLLTDAEQQFEFKGVTEAPVPSALRDFSAPVRLQHQLTDAELAFLLAHDSNDFNRWDAGQQLAYRVIGNMIAQRQAGQTVVVPELFVTAIRHVLLDTALSDALKAEALTLPSPLALAEQMATVDVEGIQHCRTLLIEQILQSLHGELLALYQQLNSAESYQVTAAQIGRRSLKNTVLGYLSHGADGIALCQAQYDAADNMTDRIAAFKLISHIDCAERPSVIADFEKNWIAYPLVMDKWFAVQACSELPSVLEHVQQLQQHPQFNLKNPNKVRALIGAFAANNLYAFHRQDGIGYQFLADKIIALNAINPQIAARLLSPLTQWRKYDAARQALMKAQLQRILQLDNLSKDVFEIASKSLG